MQCGLACGHTDRPLAARPPRMIVWLYKPPIGAIVAALFNPQLPKSLWFSVDCPHLS